MADLNEQHFSFITGVLADCQRLIAAEKVRRWEVVKWAVALNAGLAGAAAIDKVQLPPKWSVLTSVKVTIIGLALIVHFTLRARGARRTALDLENELDRRIVPRFLIDESRCIRSNNFLYDWQELFTYFVTLVGAAAVNMSAHSDEPIVLRIRQAWSAIPLKGVGLGLYLLGAVVVITALLLWPMPTDAVTGRRSRCVSHAGFFLLFVGFLLILLGSCK